MSAITTGERPLFLSTQEFSDDIPPSIADGVAGLLALDRQIIIVTGKIDGRMSGFLADLTHGISKRGSLLRIKAPLQADEFHAALAGQLHLPPQSESPMQLAARVGQRLQQPASKGSYVLLCEAADRYEVPTLEAIRQLSNYPVSIVLVGAHALTGRLRRKSLAPLRQRVTHELALNGRGLFSFHFWVAVAAALVAGMGAVQFFAPERRVEDVVPPRPISVHPASAAPAFVPALATKTDIPTETQVPPSGAVVTEPELRLHLDYDLSVLPGTAASTTSRP